MDQRALGQLYSVNELAKLAGVAPTTIRNWTSRPERALGGVKMASGRLMYRLSNLTAFIEENPDLRGARAMAQRLTALRPSDAGAGRPDPPAPSPEAAVIPEETETLRAALRDLRAAVDASVQAVARSAELAEQTAAAHREVVAALQVTVRAYDSAMTIATSSRTRHD